MADGGDRVITSYLAAEFEAGNTTLPGKEKKKKKLTRDQVIFLIGFANACNNVWEDECNETPMESRREYAFLLMGQGGSGKTAIVQEIVLPSIDFVFPPEQQHGSSSIVVCASWAQAQTMSTTAHKAVSCHNATFMRVQSQRNTDMLPTTNEAALEARLSPKRALIIEEVSMIPPSMYNMLLYRFYHGRKNDGESRRNASMYSENGPSGACPSNCISVISYNFVLPLRCLS